MERTKSSSKLIGRRGLVIKTIERCRTLGHQRRATSLMKSFSSLSPRSPKGYFTVRVGPEKERFTVKTENINHPQFEALLDEAATELGFSAEGPLELPCSVMLFKHVLQEVEQVTMNAQKRKLSVSPLSRLVRGNQGYKMLSSSHLVITGKL